MVPVKIKLTHEHAKLPTYAKVGDSGADCYALVGDVLGPGQTWMFSLGIALELPPGHEAQIRPRSSLSARGIWCALGTIDQGYRGELAAVLLNTTPEHFRIHRGDRICQLVIAPVTRAAFVEADVLSESERGSGGFGSSGR
jgi:dUTP pyrophosphatase